MVSIIPYKINLVILCVSTMHVYSAKTMHMQFLQGQEPTIVSLRIEVSSLEMSFIPCLGQNQNFSYRNNNIGIGCDVFDLIYLP